MTVEVNGHKMAYETRVCTFDDLFKVEDDAPPEEIAKIDAIRPEMDAYLSSFCAPVWVNKGESEQHQVCPKCGGDFKGSLFGAIGFGCSIEWGMVHGEGTCTGMNGEKCGWPYRGMHYPKDKDGEELFTARNLFLAYRPEHVGNPKPE
jgi:hypothetical protein